MILSYIYKVLNVLILLLIVSFLHCDLTEPPDKGSLTLTLEDVSCTEAWLTLRSINLQIPNTITLKQNNQTRMTINLVTNDTLFYIDSLLPKQTYAFQVTTSIQNPASSLSSNQANATTLDTTSHNFTWQTWTFGERTSTLYDVAIIDENNIWAVGEIYMNDSLGNPDPNLYNLIKWNGTEWKPEKIYFVNSQGQSFLAPMKSIFAFNSNDIWIGLDQIIRWNGNKYQSIEIPNAVFHSWINKLWGSGSNDLYAVGDTGNFAHYQNGVWKKIESGTDVDLKDIYGPSQGENVWISGYKDFKPTVLLKYNNGVLTKVIEKDLFGYKTDTISGWIKSIWLKRNKLFSLTFYDLYRSNTNTKGEGTAMWRGDINTWGSNAVRGNDVNDIFTAGYNGILWHYNGVSWKRYDELVNTTDPFYGMSVKGNIVVLAGERYLNGIERYGLIAIGKR